MCLNRKKQTKKQTTKKTQKKPEKGWENVYISKGFLSKIYKRVYI